MIRNRILAGVIVDKAANVRYEVWAYRKMGPAELQHHYAMYCGSRRSKKPLKNKIIKAISNMGMQGGYF